MKILFICLSKLKFNVRTPQTEPLGGTESALCYLSVALARLGHDVTLMRNATENDGTKINGVVHVKISENIAELKPDVVIVTSAPQAAPGIKKIVPNAKLILWNHMRPDQPAMLHLFREENQLPLDDIVYVSEMQRAAFVNAAASGPQCCLTDPSHGTIIGNAIAPCFENLFSNPADILAAKECRGAYTSTPFRGLAILKMIKELPIDVFSSMKVYQSDDTNYAPMYTALNENDCLTFHGSVSQSALAEQLKRNAFLVYPSIFAECHSIAILEAMAAGLKVVTTDKASPQTEFITSLSSEGATLEDYTRVLRQNINQFRAHPEMWADQMWKQVQYVNGEFTWAKKALEWQGYLQNLVT